MSRLAKAVRAVVRAVFWAGVAVVPYAVLWVATWWAGPS